MAKKPPPMQSDIFGANRELVFTDGELHGADRKKGWLLHPLAGCNVPRAERNWGGWQNLAYAIQQRVVQGRCLATEQEISDAYYYRRAYGDGTWQDYYMTPIVNAGLRAGWTPTEALLLRVEQRRQVVLARGNQPGVE